VELSQLEQLLMQYSSQELDDEGQRRLRKALVDDEATRLHAARWMQNDSLLRGELLIGEVAHLFADQAGVPAASDCHTVHSFVRSAERVAELPPTVPPLGRRLQVSYSLAAAVAACVLLSLGVNSWFLWRGEAPAASLPTLSPAMPQVVHGRLLDTTVCVWGTLEGAAPLTGQRLVEGDSFQLLEGIATFGLEFGDMTASLEVEGPAAIMLARGGVPSLRYGKMTLDVDGPPGARFPVEVAFGEVLTRTGSETGIVSFGSKGQVHVFAGSATVRSAWLTPEETGSPQMEIDAGQAVTLSNVGGHILKSKVGSADRSAFTPNVSMGADYLEVTPEYVREVEQASPVGYWRFEGEGEQRTANHVAGHAPLEVKGEVQWVGPEGNQAIEFGMAPSAGWLLSSESWDETLADDFSVELWMKPSHYHYGAMIGFAGPYDQRRRMNSYGVGIELGGTYLANSYQKPRQVRSFYRAPLGIAGGPSVYSGEANEYRARRWQHVVSVHQGSRIALYLDGKLVDTNVAPGPIPQGLQLLLGQLYTESVSRPFVGDLDEVAIYDRALEAEEIERHYNLLRSNNAQGQPLRDLRPDRGDSTAFTPGGGSPTNQGFFSSFAFFAAPASL
jgi:hypothetical protein